jgi:hypothetical protein
VFLTKICVQVFKVLWSEPIGNTGSGTDVELSECVLKPGKLGEKVYSSIRRFVVVANGQGHSQCV